MNIFGGGGNIFSGIANLALQGALGVMTGGTSLLVTTALKGVMMAVGDQLIEKLGQQLGLPPAITDMAQAAFHAAAGDPGGAVQNLQEASQGLASAIGGDVFDQGQIERTGNEAVSKLLDEVLKGVREGSDEEGNKKDAKAALGSKGESFLVAFAKALGKTIDRKMENMMEISKKIDAQTQAANDSGGKKQAVVGELSAELQGLSQEVNFISQALTNSVKAIGESVSTIARKG